MNHKKLTNIIMSDDLEKFKDLVVFGWNPADNDNLAIKIASACDSIKIIDHLLTHINVRKTLDDVTLDKHPLIRSRLRLLKIRYLDL